MSWWKIVLNGVLSALSLGKKHGKFSKDHGPNPGTPERYHDVRDNLRKP